MNATYLFIHLDEHAVIEGAGFKGPPALTP
jgi:hypothetical protein